MSTIDNSDRGGRAAGVAALFTDIAFGQKRDLSYGTLPNGSLNCRAPCVCFFFFFSFISSSSDRTWLSFRRRSRFSFSANARNAINRLISEYKVGRAKRQKKRVGTHTHTNRLRRIKRRRSCDKRRKEFSEIIREEGSRGGSIVKCVIIWAFPFNSYLIVGFLPRISYVASKRIVSVNHGVWSIVIKISFSWLINICIESVKKLINSATIFNPVWLKIINWKFQILYKLFFS